MRALQEAGEARVGIEVKCLAGCCAICSGDIRGQEVWGRLHLHSVIDAGPGFYLDDPRTIPFLEEVLLVLTQESLRLGESVRVGQARCLIRRLAKAGLSGEECRGAFSEIWRRVQLELTVGHAQGEGGALSVLMLLLLLQLFLDFGVEAVSLLLGHPAKFDSWKRRRIRGRFSRDKNEAGHLRHEQF